LQKMQERYSRQEALPEIGKDGQALLGKAKIMIIGLGALGTAQATYLARAGIGELILIDRDIVELNNLHRQMLFDEDDIDKPKAVAAKDHISRINNDVKISAHVAEFNASIAEKLVSSVDLVLDGTDNMETRYLINDVCVKLGKAWIYGGAVGTFGMMLPIIPNGLCLRCIFPEIPSPGNLPTCDTAGILNTLPPVIAAFQVTEAIKIILDREVSSNLLIIDMWTQDIRNMIIGKDDSCPACGKRRYDFLNAKNRRAYLKMCGRNAVQILPKESLKIPLASLRDRLEKVGRVEMKSDVLFFAVDENELVIFSDGRTIVRGTDNPVKARALFSKYVGD